MPDAHVLEVADRWWAGDFACSPHDLRPTTTHVQAHAGLLAQDRTLEANGPSMGIARRLGFEPYGLSVYVRLQAG